MDHHDDARLIEVVSEIVGDADTKAVFRRLLQLAMQELIETELSATIGAKRHERAEACTHQRNGWREKRCDAGVSKPTVSRICAEIRQAGG